MAGQGLRILQEREWRRNLHGERHSDQKAWFFHERGASFATTILTVVPVRSEKLCFIVSSDVMIFF